MGSWSLGAVVVETSAFKIGKRQFRCVAVNYTREDRLFSEKEILVDLAAFERSTRQLEGVAESRALVLLVGGSGS